MGVLAAAALPVAVFLAEIRELYDLLYAAAAAPPALAGGVTALVLARRARERSERTLGRVGGRAAAAVGSLFGLVAVLLASAALIALATYYVIARLAE